MELKREIFRPVGFTFLLMFTFIIFSCSRKNNSRETFYTKDDFKNVGKIDAHTHLTTGRPLFPEQAAEDNFRVLVILGDGADGLTMDQQLDSINGQQKKFPGRIQFLTNFSMKGWGEKDWQEKTLAFLEKSFQWGAAGLKVWKNIGMIEKDKDGRFIMIDDPSFDPVFNYLEKKGIPVTGHLGEPRNCWLPLDSMTVNNDRQYYASHPEFHMYLHAGYPSYKDQIDARDHLLEKHPELKFIGAHLGSMEWSVDMMAAHFDRFPNFYVDMAERMCHLELQSQKDRQKVRDFMIKYQDRILYGTDRGDYFGKAEDEVKPWCHETWENEWEYLATGDTMTEWEVNGKFRGLQLPKDVIDKIYYKNAEKVFPQFKNM